MKTGRPAKTPRSDFGRRVRDLREEANLSQSEVAHVMGISQPSYAAWERREVALTASQLGTLAKTFRCEVADFFHHESPKRGRGPTGRASKTFEELSKLPRSKQKDIVDLVENLITAYRIRQAKKEEAQAS